ncbi:NUDIX hydrolase [Alkalihalobacillus pseudalcaliphilus]|uniref:NUDIX hydrolase n=1 Tax=Alkalihalobacillus pseudalcaliphilus TaxID=79884 RepID=UPI00064DBE58|nr:NUDIX hydrolase [Alkalihalobacillus pseudalcaliphilus]KMK75821.1 hypothetical protein AB990_11180 [Alkalihalobacillus pseudalcaliphilus]
MKRIDVVYNLVFNDKNEVLIVRNKKRDDWSLPGGRVEEKETLKEAAKREMTEETGYKIEVGEIVSVDEAFINQIHVHFFTFLSLIIGGKAAIIDVETVAEIRWVSVEEANRLVPFYQKGFLWLRNESIPYTFHGGITV